MPKHNLEVFCDFRNDKLTFQKNLKTFDEKCHFTHCTGNPEQNSIKFIGILEKVENFSKLCQKLKNDDACGCLEVMGD